MVTPLKPPGDAVRELPPLILHPFNERVAPSTLLENSKAALMLAGLVPEDGADPDDLERRLLAGRYAEIRMLYFVGKDVSRWTDQCCECAARTPELSDANLQPQSFAGLLTANPPQSVKDKLIRWGVADYASIFARAIGLHALFVQPPALESLSAEFLRNYHRYADALFRCYMETRPHPIAAGFRFELYASGEYSKMLESQWGEAQ